MATDNWGQTIPSWVEDNSYECATMQTITQNDAHPTPMTSAQFCTMMKESGDKYIVRDGIVKDSDWMDGKFIEDLGFYDPHENPSKVDIDVEKAVTWLDKGAQPSERAQKILEISGAWAQWRSSKGEVVSIPKAPEEKIKSSSKANNKKQEENLDEQGKDNSEDVTSDKEEE